MKCCVFPSVTKTHGDADLLKEKVRRPGAEYFTGFRLKPGMKELIPAGRPSTPTTATLPKSIFTSETSGAPNSFDSSSQQTFPALDSPHYSTAQDATPINAHSMKPGFNQVEGGACFIKSGSPVSSVTSGVAISACGIRGTGRVTVPTLPQLQQEWYHIIATAEEYMIQFVFPCFKLIHHDTNDQYIANNAAADLQVRDDKHYLLKFEFSYPFGIPRANNIKFSNLGTHRHDTLFALDRTVVLPPDVHPTNNDPVHVEWRDGVITIRIKRVGNNRTKGVTITPSGSGSIAFPPAAITTTTTTTTTATADPSDAVEKLVEKKSPASKRIEKSSSPIPVEKDDTVIQSSASSDTFTTSTSGIPAIPSTTTSSEIELDLDRKEHSVGTPPKNHEDEKQPSDSTHRSGSKTASSKRDSSSSSSPNQQITPSKRLKLSLLSAEDVITNYEQVLTNSSVQPVHKRHPYVQYITSEGYENIKAPHYPSRVGVKEGECLECGHPLNKQSPFDKSTAKYTESRGTVTCQNGEQDEDVFICTLRWHKFCVFAKNDTPPEAQLVGKRPHKRWFCRICRSCRKCSKKLSFLKSKSAPKVYACPEEFSHVCETCKDTAAPPCEMVPIDNWHIVEKCITCGDANLWYWNMN